MQTVIDSINKSFPVFRELLSAFPFPVIDFFESIFYLLLAFVIAKVIINAI